MICKKCGHDVDKYEVILIWIDTAYDEGYSMPYCPCGAKLEEKQ